MSKNSVLSQIRKMMTLKIMPESPILGRWKNDNNYIKTDLANHDCCGDKLCGDPKKTSQYISKNLKSSK